MNSENTRPGIELDEERNAPIAMDGDSFRRAGHVLVDSIADFLQSLPERPVTPDESPETIRELIGGDAPMPEEGADSQALLERAAELLYEHSLFNGHPRFFGYVTSSPAPIGMLGDLLAAAVNPNVGAWRISPMASEIEMQTVRWIAELIGYPRDCGGLLVSGGNMANITGLLGARVAALGGEVRQTGVAGPGAARPRVYASAETHTWIQKAVDIAGLGTDAIRWIPVDERLRMKVDVLRRTIKADREAGELSLMVAGTAGSVSTGAVDPLADIAGLCRELDIWLHVDGAYGGFAAALPDASDDLRALSLADSVALDPHKWLYAPLEAGCVLVREPQHLRDAFSYHPQYYHFGQEATNFVDFGPQNSRGFRALKVWLALQQVGRRGYVRMIGDDIRLAHRLYDLVAAHDELEAFTRDLSIATFRYVPSYLRSEAGTESGEAYLNRLNQELLERLQRSGEVFVSNAVIGGRYVLRACIVNFHTGAGDIEAVPEIVLRHGRAVDAELRPGG
ncbi:MAG: aspartate aminotransferase family protein [Gammaproteobacteria bacterium]|nr:aspartate aminotransferase family protein [Gammaproteobacteria bacterium]